MPTPINPYLIFGTPTDESSSTLPEDTVVKAHNTTTDERIETRLNSSGQYVLDLANLTSGYSEGDSITVYVRNKGYTGETSFTLSGEGGRETNISTANQVTFATLRNTIWKAFYDTIQTGTFEISEDSIFSSMNDKLLSREGYPVVIMHTPTVDRVGYTLPNEDVECSVSFLIEIFHTSSENAKILSDEVENKVWLAQEVWDGLNLRDLETPSVDNDWYTEGNKKIHIISFNANFIYEGTVNVP